MTYEEIISQVKTPKNKGIYAQTDRLSARYIIAVALRKRSRVVKQEREKKNLKERFLQQSLCVPLIEVSKHECACVSINGCKVLRSSYKIPAVIKDSVNSVTSIDGSKIFTPTAFKDYGEYSRLPKINPKYYILNEYLYVTGISNLEWVKVIGVFEDPLAVDLLSSCNDNSSANIDCTNALTTNFKIAPDLEDSVITLTLEEIFNSWKYGNQDIINNQLEEAR